MAFLSILGSKMWPPHTAIISALRPEKNGLSLLVKSILPRFQAPKK
jgi:hypothetical protein